MRCRTRGKLLAEWSLDEPTVSIEVDEVVLEALVQAGDHHQLAPLGRRPARPDGGGRSRPAAPGARPAPGLPACGLRTTRHAAAAHLTASAGIAAALRDSELAARADTVAARNALAASDLGTAERLARQALATAEAAGLTGWAAEVAVESLEVIGRRERCRNLTAARRAFERSLDIADTQGTRASGASGRVT